MLNTYLTIMISLGSCLIGMPAFAASSDWIEHGPNRLRMVVAEPLPGESTVRAVLDIDLAPGWKTYWQDPGDAGVPLQLSLDGSDNASDPVIRFPLPRRFDDGVTVWSGYDRPVQIPVTFTRSVPDKAGALVASVFLGICENICVPVSAKFTVPFGNIGTDIAETFLVDQAFARLPAAANGNNGIVAAMLKDEELHITTAMGSVPPTELFLAAPNGWQFAAPVIARTEGLNVIFTAKILYKADQGAKGTFPVGYTLTNGKASVFGYADILVR